MELNGEVIVLDEGKVLQKGPAKEIFENPSNLKVAEISNMYPMHRMALHLILSLRVARNIDSFAIEGKLCDTQSASVVEMEQRSA